MIDSYKIPGFVWVVLGPTKKLRIALIEKLITRIRGSRQVGFSSQMKKRILSNIGAKEEFHNTRINQVIVEDCSKLKVDAIDEIVNKSLHRGFNVIFSGSCNSSNPQSRRVIGLALAHADEVLTIPDNKETEKRRGILRVFSGCMFSGKTKALIKSCWKAASAGHKVIVFKPILDTRYRATVLSTHDGIQLDGVYAVSASDDIMKIARWSKASFIAIDEAQFFDSKLLKVTAHLRKRGLVIHVAVLDRDYTGQAWNEVVDLLGMADEVFKLKASCSVCRGEAVMSFRTSQISKRIHIGGTKDYEPRCKVCFLAGLRTRDAM